MTAPTFAKKRDNVATDSTNVKYGAPDWTHFVDVLDATHATQRIQASVIEGSNTTTYDVVVYISGTTIYARRADGTVINSGVAGTNDSAVIQSAFDEGGTTTTKTPTVVVFKPGLYKPTTTPTTWANTTVIGYGATLQSQVYTVVLHKIGAGHSNVAIYGLTFDFNEIGNTIGPQCNDTTGACKNILFQDCKFINGFIKPLTGPGSGQNPEDGNDDTRMMFFRYNMPTIAEGGGMPAHRYENIRLINCDFDAEGMRDNYGVCQLQNIVGGLVLGCRFYNTAPAKHAALFLYPHNDGMIVADCKFYNNTIYDISVTQNVNIFFLGNEISNNLSVSDVRNLVIVGNRLKRIDINDHDNPTHEGTWTSFVIGSKDILIAHNNFNTLPVAPQSIGQVHQATIHCGLQHSHNNPPENIFIVNNTARCDRSFVLINDIENDGVIKPDVMTAPLDTLVITGNHITERVSGTSTGIIRLHGNTLVPNNGFNNIFIARNYFAPSPDTTTTWDIDFVTTGMTNIQIRDNWFNNKGINNIASYVNNSTNSIISGNYGTTTTTVDTNSGTATFSSGTSVAVTHGLNHTPPVENIFVRPTNAMGGATKWWVSNPTSTQFTINVNSTPSGAANFVWVAGRP